MVVEVSAQDGASYLIAIAADGAGSAKFAQTGAELTCDAGVRHLSHVLARSTNGVEAIVPVTVVEAVRDAIRAKANELNGSMRDFACTVVAAIIGAEQTLYFQIGDGAIVARQGDELECVFWPEGGEYANTTFFVTDADAPQRIQHRVMETSNDLALLTDGLQRLALVFSTRAVHAPFFEPMFTVLRNAPDDSDDLSSSLAAFMDSEAVNSRTDDDKTLILISRLSGAGCDPVTG
ncbi:AcrR family transcriptional regulator [Paraburkholderia sp. Clong3]